MRPVFCGNFEYDAREGDLERLFRRYGKVDRVDMKAGKLSCFLFVVNLGAKLDSINSLTRIRSISGVRTVVTPSCLVPSHTYAHLNFTHALKQTAFKF